MIPCRDKGFPGEGAGRKGRWRRDACKFKGFAPTILLLFSFLPLALVPLRFCTTLRCPVILSGMIIIVRTRGARALREISLLAKGFRAKLQFHCEWDV